MHDFIILYEEEELQLVLFRMQGYSYLPSR